jgi:hypothetical protein
MMRNQIISPTINSLDLVYIASWRIYLTRLLASYMRQPPDISYIIATAAEDDFLMLWCQQHVHFDFGLSNTTLFMTPVPYFGTT